MADASEDTKVRCVCDRPILVDERHLRDGVRCCKCGHRRIDWAHYVVVTVARARGILTALAPVY